MKNTENRFYLARKNCHFTQGQVARLLNLRDTAVSKWECGQTLPDGRTLKRVAELYGVSSDYLLGLEESQDLFDDARIEPQFSIRLKELRKARGLLQIDVAKAIGINNSTYAYYEREDRKLTSEILCRLADFFDVTVDELLGRTQPSLFDDARIEQQRVLQMYQQLTPHQQDLIMERMQGFIDGNVERQQFERAQQASRPAVQYFIPTRQQIDE